MISDIRSHQSIKGRMLDDYLSRGWYRMGQFIFTGHVMVLNERFHLLHWLRLSVAEINYGKKQKSIIRKNGRFHTRIKPFAITEEIENLYTLYRASTDFEASPSVYSYLMEGNENNVFDTQCIEVRDNDKLIAIGYFDEGENSIAGILNFYDPAYSSFSLGKYLMLVKIDYGKKMSKQWYYTGYIVNGYPKFDYKLFADIHATQVFNRHDETWSVFQWTSIFNDVLPDNL